MTLQSLATNPLVALGGFVLGVLGIILAIVFYVRAKKEKEPVYEIKSTTLIEGLHKRLDGLQLLYKGAPQERLSVTKIAIWNAGRETIDQTDVVNSVPFGIAFGQDVGLLDVQIVSCSPQSVSAELQPVVQSDAGQLIPLSFAYLDQNDYIVIQIVHDGDADVPFELRGKIKGVKRLQRLPMPYVPSFVNSPFLLPIGPLLGSRTFVKYFAPLIYLSVATACAAEIYSGNHIWYVWTMGGISLFAAFVLYYGMGRPCPVKI